MHVYNIPVSVCLLETYPFCAPVCFVNPTENMVWNFEIPKRIFLIVSYLKVIHESAFVNGKGRVSLPCLSNWQFPGNDLKSILEVCSTSFLYKVYE